MTFPANAIAVKNVSKVYQIYKNPQDRIKQIFFKKQYYKEFWALKDISFNVPRGEVVGIIGKNGSGKSTLLQIIANTLTPTSGHVQINGRVAALLELGSGFNPEFTGRENVYMNGSILGLSREEIDENFHAIEAFAEIGDFIDQPVKTYSSGMMVRLAFAVSVHVNAEILIIDEALAVGDIAFQFKCLNRLEELLNEKTTILLVSHDIQMIKSYCRNAIYLKDGKQVYSGDCETTSEMYMMDMRAERQSSVNTGAVNLQPAINSENGISFGSGGGKIIGLEMGSGDELKDYFGKDEEIRVRVTAKVRKDIRNPRFALVVRDERGYNIFGYDSLALGKVPLTPDENGIITGFFTFSCLLQTGNYSITLRLEDYQSDTLNLLLDKQVNAANFKVIIDEKHFDGVVNLNGGFKAGRNQ